MHGRQDGLTGSTCRPFDDLCRPDIVDISRVPDLISFDLGEILNIVNFFETFDTLDNERNRLRDRVTQLSEPLKTPEIMHLEAQLDEKLYDLRVEEVNLNGNTESWLRLARMHQGLKKEFPNINEPIDLSSPEAQTLIDCATLMVKNDLATLQMQVAMKENYKRIKKMMVEAQTILDQLVAINPADRKYEEIGNTFKIKSDPGRGWEGFIKRMALVIHHTGT
ncbi:hypothetical protein D6D01_10287 [Aureobasidium pullulans]|uniref:Uncharacterized protein n=1 Tax=Aureobasidium pullulans TaxID=5580 RepID=A0A4S9JLZ8_AURPU|nr:hypothetical protein D6D01_10287 [Aureobasidium pullulans]